MTRPYPIDRLSIQKTETERKQIPDQNETQTKQKKRKKDLPLGNEGLLAATISPASSGYVKQRTNGVGDCMIAAIATVTESSYETIAKAFGFPCDPVTGLPAMPPGRGIAADELAVPLLRLGFASTVIMSATVQSYFPGVTVNSTIGLVSEAELRHLLIGRRAVVLIPSHDRFHALAWKDATLIDCRPSCSDDPYRRIEDEDILAAVTVVKG